MRRKLLNFALVGAAAALASCAPKALVVTDSAGPAKKTAPSRGTASSPSPAAVAQVPKKASNEATFAPVPTPPAQTAAAKRPAPAAPLPARGNGDGLRMPDMLGLPQDKELKSSGSSGSGGGAVISRPPSE